MRLRVLHVPSCQIVHLMMIRPAACRRAKMTSARSTRASRLTRALTQSVFPLLRGPALSTTATIASRQPRMSMLDQVSNHSELCPASMANISTSLLGVYGTNTKKAIQNELLLTALLPLAAFLDAADFDHETSLFLCSSELSSHLAHHSPSPADPHDEESRRHATKHEHGPLIAEECRVGRLFEPARSEEEREPDADNAEEVVDTGIQTGMAGSRGCDDQKCHQDHRRSGVPGVPRPTNHEDPETKPEEKSGDQDSNVPDRLRLGPAANHQQHSSHQKKTDEKCDALHQHETNPQ